MKLKKGTISTRCWDLQTDSETRIPQNGLISDHFGIHKQVHTEPKDVTWVVTHLNTGMVAMKFDLQSWARRAVALLESTPAPLPWEQLTLENLAQTHKNLDVIMEIKAKATKP